MNIADVLSVDRVKAAYAQIGVPPRRGSWSCNDKTCAIGAVFRAERGKKPMEPEEVAAYLGVPLAQVVNFIFGFDSPNPLLGMANTPSGVREAYEHGRAIAAEVFSAGAPV